MNEVYEYDGYTLPEPIKKETPETKALVKKKLKDLDELIEQMRMDANISSNKNE